MNLVDKYIIRQLFSNSILILILIISLFCLAKSVQLIELMVGRGLPFLIFIKLILLSLPQIIPVLLPVIVSLSVFFVFSRMQTDKELVVLLSSNFSFYNILKPTLIFCIIISSMSFFFTLYQSPKSNEDFKILLYGLKDDYSSTLLQEGTFNTFGKNFTIFVKERKKDGLHNVFIHDTRDEGRTSTLIAKKGKLISTTDSTKILLENGSQHFQSKEKKLSVLYFDQYLLDINQNNNSSMLNRWKSPSERTIYELKNPDPKSGDDINNLQAFKAELTLRHSLPLNVIGFGSMILFVILSFSFQRKEDVSRTILVFFTIILLQSISIISSNLSIKYLNMEVLNFFPILFCLVSLIFLMKRSKKL
jgi:lipopolysaccharide export system permease protein